MDIYEKVNNLIRRLERSKSKTVSKQAILQEIEEVAKLYLDLICIPKESKKIGNKLWDISQGYRQSKKEILKTLKIIKCNLSQFEIKKELENFNLKAGRVVIFTDGQNYSACDQLKNFFASAKHVVDIIDPYLDSDTFQIFKKVPEKLKIRLITDLRNFHMPAKTDFNKFKKEYSIETRNSQLIHDRFFIIDNNGYFSGSSLHSAGNKLSAIALMSENDTKILQEEFNKIWNQSKKII